ncbi:hypothetical protein [Pseudomonas sp. AL03]|uniref:FitA-like ribbon-helix-helix domain-containing protein n=1 Tax=Pseudomonas sp. AL03 TaxID=3042230 RepID=UPI00249ACC31|nr:hypothetical protein [Pseudomonas sp. AL03]MDI3270789.1 hypothetical protein [Pseudomonas sp. AL03]
MASITLSNLDSRHFKQLRISTDCNGCSMEEEARMILVHALNQNDCAKGRGLESTSGSEPMVELSWSCLLVRAGM